MCWDGAEHVKLPLFFCPNSLLVKPNGLELNALRFWAFPSVALSLAECDEFPPYDLPKFRQGRSLLLLCRLELTPQGFLFLPQLADLDLSPFWPCWNACDMFFCDTKPLFAYAHYEGAHSLGFLVSISVWCCLQDLGYVLVQLYNISSSFTFPSLVDPRQPVQGSLRKQGSVHAAGLEIKIVSFMCDCIRAWLSAARVTTSCWIQSSDLLTAWKSLWSTSTRLSRASC